jgi:hypothetical protein
MVNSVVDYPLIEPAQHGRNDRGRWSRIRLHIGLVGNMPNKSRVIAPGIKGGYAGVGAGNTLIDYVRSNSLQSQPKRWDVGQERAGNRPSPTDLMNAVSLGFVVFIDSAADEVNVHFRASHQVFDEYLALVLSTAHSCFPMHRDHDADCASWGLSIA